MARQTAIRRIGAAGSALAVLAAVAVPALAQQRAAPPAFVDERRLPPTDAEIKAKAEADRSKAAAREAKEKAEAQQRDAAEAEARQKAEEQRRQAAEAEAKQKAETQRREAAEAEAKQKAETQRREAAEAEARQKAEAQRREAAEAEARQKSSRSAAPPATSVPAPPAPAPAVRTGAGECGPDRISARAIAGGRVEMDIETPCRAGQTVVVRYGVFELKRRLDGAGRAVVVLDLFQGKSPPVTLQIGASPAQPVSLEAVDLSGLSKAAVVWQAPVNLDLHVYEYAARHGDAGHIWPGAPSTAEAAESEARATKRGRGFLSTSDDGRSEGDKVEVYTFWHNPEQRSGLVATALDFETRGANPSADTCGNGAHASVVYETFLLNARGELSRERGAIAPATCGSELAGAGRYMEDAVPDLAAAP